MLCRWPLLVFPEWLWMQFLTCRSPCCQICHRQRRRRTFPVWLKTHWVRGSRNGTFSSITWPKKGTLEIKTRRTPLTRENSYLLSLKHTRKILPLFLPICSHTIELTTNNSIFTPFARLKIRVTGIFKKCFFFDSFFSCTLSWKNGHSSCDLIFGLSPQKTSVPDVVKCAVQVFLVRT